MYSYKLMPDVYQSPFVKARYVSYTDFNVANVTDRHSIDEKPEQKKFWGAYLECAGLIC